MRVTMLLILSLSLIACAATAPKVPRTPEQHAANLTAAQQAGYKVVVNGERTTFCPSMQPTGSHMAATCISESQFEALLGSRYAPPAAHFTNTSPGPGPGAGH
ncbi:MAG TPA: hypothetical protein VID49_04265 [Steroidobacteraceae bacterium]